MGARVTRRRVLVGGLAAGAVAGLGRVSPAAADNGPAIALTHVTVIDGTGAKPRPDMTVLVRGDRIVALGRHVHIPDGTRVVDLTGKYLIPGLHDMHVHSGDWERVFPALYVVNGVTTVRQLGGNAFHHEWRDKIESGALLGPRQSIGSIYLDGVPSQWTGVPVGPIEVKDAAEARAAVRRVKAESADFVKIYSRLSNEAYFAIADEARRQRIPFAGHWPDVVAPWDAVSSGQRTFEHLYGILFATSSEEAEIRPEVDKIVLDPPQQNGNPFHTYASWWRRIHPLEWRAAHSHDPRKARRLFARLAAHRAWQTPTLITLRWVDIPGDPPPDTSERLKYLPAAARGHWPFIRAAMLANRGPDEIKQRVELFRRRGALAVEMHNAGVPLLAGSDDATPGLVPGFALHDELIQLVEAGLTPMRALQSATIEPSRYLGWSDSLGTVQRGKLADLVVLDADPLRDIANTQKIHAVVVRGRLLTARDRQRMFAEIEAAAAEESAKGPVIGCCG